MTVGSEFCSQKKERKKKRKKPSTMEMNVLKIRVAAPVAHTCHELQHTRQGTIQRKKGW